MSTDQKNSLEIRKISLEITELERQWWKRPSYILAALPTLLAIAALSVGFLNGFFSAQLTKLENQRHDLAAEVKEFEARRAELSRQNETLTIENTKIKAELEGRTVEARRRMDEALQCRRDLAALKHPPSR